MNIQNTEWLSHPLILEINTWPWLYGLSERYNYLITLQNVPEEVIDNEFKYFDVIWLMGVWERSPKGREIAINHPGLQEEYRQALRYFSTDDVVGSPYAIHYYHVDSNLGSETGLDYFRKQLADRGILLILDYVPNHVAIDHVWVLEKSNTFIEGTFEEQISNPDKFFSAGGKVYAHGLDPYFFDNPWTDTVQINAFSKEARQKTINTLLNIAEQCDGVRCDMAMLLINEVFKRTWGERGGKPLEKEFWREVIPAVKEKFPNFKFIAEVYWDLEWELQQQGFDYCYDKKLYERLIHDDARSIRTHLLADMDYQSKLVRFIENHDEQRAVKVFGEKKSRAAAIITLTLPGARLIHEGQTQGHTIKLPVQLRRRPMEENNAELVVFYNKLLKIIPGKELGKGQWSLCKVEPVGKDASYENLIAYIWEINNLRQLTVVNFSTYLTQGHIRIGGLHYGSNNWTFTDLFTQKKYTYKGEDLDNYGLYVDLDAFQGHILDIKKND
ncbi:MAG: alpha-amylase [Promethearchaeota archaeon]|nr:MAG: alpha-amylase [Candidatus Lokiarchaeota archaeon]